MNYRRMPPPVAAAVVVLVVVMVVGIVLWRLAPHKGPAEVAAPSVKQADGSVVLERKPEPKAKPVHQLPKGAKIERQVSVTIQPRGIWAPGFSHGGEIMKPPATPPSEPVPEEGTVHFLAAEKISCPPVTVDLSLVRMPDQTRRVVASSPDGQVIAGMDVPVESAVVVERKWAVGLSYDPVKETPGIWIERDISRIRLGAELNQTRIRVGGPTGGEFRLRAGVTF